MTIASGHENIDLSTLLAGLENGTILLVDVREPAEFSAGHIPGSVSLPLSRFDPAGIPDPAGRKVVFSCAAGVRSLHAIAGARAAGLGHRAHFPGGFREWVMAGLPVTTA